MTKTKHRTQLAAAIIVALFLGHWLGYWYGRNYELYESEKRHHEIPVTMSWGDWLKRK